MLNNNRASIAFWVCSVTTFASAAVSAAFSLAALLTVGAENVYAKYAASRSFALPIVILLVIVGRSRAALAAMAVVMTLVQTFDAIIGFRLGSPAKAYGPLSLAVFTTLAVVFLVRSPPSPRE